MTRQPRAQGRSAAQAPHSPRARTGGGHANDPRGRTSKPAAIGSGGQLPAETCQIPPSDTMRGSCERFGAPVAKAGLCLGRPS